MSWDRLEPGFPQITAEARVAQHAADRPDQPAVICGDRQLTWRELDDRANAVVERWAAMGIVADARVAWLGRNQLEFPVFLIAARRAGVIFVGLNWRLSKTEMTALLASVECRLVLGDPDFRHLLPDDTEWKSIDTFFADLPAPQRAHASPFSGDGITTIFFTSGTTGLPKAFGYTHETSEITVTSPQTLDFTATSRLLIVAPVFHLAGWMWTLYGLQGGMTQVLLSNPSPQGLIEAVAAHGVTHAQWVPAMLVDALEAYDRAPADLSSLRMIAYGASPIQPALLARAQATFGCEFSQVYGLTETVGPISHLPAEAHHTAKSQATGQINLGVDVRIELPDGSDAASGEAGEVMARMPYAAAVPFVNDQPDRSVPARRWIATGDSGCLDADGYLHVQGRVTDMLITGGENVYPAEVENVIGALPGVVETAVFAVSDPRFGDRICAAVVMRRDTAFDEQRMIEDCRRQLAHYKCPKHVIACDSLPRNALGKVIRRDLTERFEREHYASTL